MPKVNEMKIDRTALIENSVYSYPQETLKTCNPIMQLCVVLIVIATVTTAASNSAFADTPAEPAKGHTNAAEYRDIPSCHGGAGTVSFMKLLDGDDFTSNLMYIERGVIPPGASIGEHRLIGMEEMYFVFNAPAEFTVNGQAALLPAGSCVLCPDGSTHGIYNPGNEPLEWLNIAVGKTADDGVSVDLGNDLTNQRLDSPAPFKWGLFDFSLLRKVGPAHNGAGKILNRRPWVDGNFSTTFKRIGHCVLPPGTSIGYHQHNCIEEIYYVMAGSGYMTVNDTTWEISAGDAAGCRRGESHGLYNHSNEDLEIFVLQVDVDDIGEDINWGDDLTGKSPR